MSSKRKSERKRKRATKYIDSDEDAEDDHVQDEESGNEDTGLGQDDEQVDTDKEKDDEVTPKMLMAVLIRVESKLDRVLNINSGVTEEKANTIATVVRDYIIDAINAGGCVSLAKKNIPSTGLGGFSKADLANPFKTQKFKILSTLTTLAKSQFTPRQTSTNRAHLNAIHDILEKDPVISKYNLSEGSLDMLCGDVQDYALMIKKKGPIPDWASDVMGTIHFDDRPSRPVTKVSYSSGKSTQAVTPTPRPPPSIATSSSSTLASPQAPVPRPTVPYSLSNVLDAASIFK